MRISKVLLLLAMLCISSQASAYTHNITTVGSGMATWLSIYDNVSPAFEFRNSGTSDEHDVMLYCRITSESGGDSYADSIDVKNWSAGKTLDTVFRGFTPAISFESYRITAFAALPNDENRLDDTLRWHASTRYESDIAVDSVSFPWNSDSIPEKTNYHVRGLIVNTGAADIYEYPARTSIRRQTDGALVFQADTIFQASYADSPAVEYPFPSHQGLYDVRKLAPGNYVAAVIVRYPTDGDRTNDTAISSFTVVPHVLEHDLAIDSIFERNRTILRPDTSIAIGARIRNVGSSSEQGFIVRALVYDWNDSIVYRDSVLPAQLTPGSYESLTFKNFKPVRYGSYRIAYKALLAGDEYPFNDSLATQLYVGPVRDAAVLSIDAPHAHDTLESGQLLRVNGTIQWKGSEIWSQSLRVGAQLLSLAGDVRFKSDTVVSELSVDHPIANYTIIGLIDTAAQPGDYLLRVYLETPDNDVTNDTLSEVVTVVRRTEGVNGSRSPVTEFISPNPAHSYIAVHGFAVRGLVVVDMTGRSFACHVEESPGDIVRIDISSLPAGRYFVRSIEPASRALPVSFVKE